MNLLRISHVPPKQWPKILAEFEASPAYSYSDVLAQYFARFIAVSDAIVHELNASGKCVANEVIYNHKPLQNLWAKSFQKGDQLTELEILKLQIEHFQPDIVFVNTNLVDLATLKSLTKKKTFFIVWDGFIKPNLISNGPYDLVLTCLPSIADKYKARGTKSVVLNFGFDSRILGHIETKKTETLNFVGNLSFVHLARQSFIHSLVHDKTIDFNLYLGNYDTGKNIFSRTILREMIQNKNFKNLSAIYNLQKANGGSLYGLGMYEAIARANSTLNFHGDEVDRACNMRLFEATGVGTCLITDNKPGLSDFFKLEEEVLVFDTVDDLQEKVKYLQDNENVARKIGLNGQRRIMAEHLWSHRIVELLGIIERHI
jgi:spore maturation protein CgeB